MNKIDTQKETESLLNTDRDFAAASIELGSAEAFNKFLSDDAYQFPQGGIVIKGRDNIYESMRGSDSEYILEWTPQHAEVSESADMGWTWGKYQVRARDSADSVISYGKYLNVWKKDAKGNWKVIADIGNKSPDPVTGE